MDDRKLCRKIKCLKCGRLHVPPVEYDRERVAVPECQYCGSHELRYCHHEGKCAEEGLWHGNERRKPLQFMKSPSKFRRR